MFALRSAPPGEVSLRGQTYRLARVFKHDFWAATCLYRSDDPHARYPAAVIKFGRSQDFAGLPLRWLGLANRDHEEAIYRRLEGLPGVPDYLGRVGEMGYAIEYVDAKPLDHLDVPPAGFFDRLRTVFDNVHARGVAYVDSNKRSNILVRPDGSPVLIDFQISIARRPDLPPPLRNLIDRVVDYMIGRDIYHLYKHKRRLAPHELTVEEEILSRKRSGVHALHRRLTKPYRALRRRFLRKQHETGRLVSPTAELEDHYQPEKATWRESDAQDSDEPSKPTGGE